MIPTTYQGIQILLVLLPGFFTARIVGALTVRPNQTDLDKAIEALFYSFFVYFICVVFLRVNPLVVDIKVNAKSATLDINPDSLRNFVSWAFVVAGSLGLAISYLSTNDLVTGFLRWIKVTKRSSRISVWSDVFHDLDEFVVVEFTDGRRVRGWPRMFSDTPEEGSLFLEKASWILDDETPVEIHGAGILITKNLRIQSVSFIDSK
ncbi:MAG: hypothetical protein IVW56_11985 [Candidatus Binataceae bacterium]|nr:hypothetical protein [Candidatus Binataceae bacterium]